MNYVPPRLEIPTKQFSSKIMVFTFDDIPFEKCNDRLDEFHAWMNSEAISSPLQMVIQQFTARLSGALKEWWNSLGDDDNDATCSYSDYDNSSESSPDEDDDCCFKITKFPRHDEIQTPHLPVTIFDPSCQEDPVHAIAFIDTEAHTTIINPKILSPSMWLPHQQEFCVANSDSLTIKLKSKPIKIELFPGCHITAEVLGSPAPGKDLILGWDSCYAFKKHSISRSNHAD
ncbi:hypothetical protein DY000_02041477 [Brassica cretica]|uniref:Reverse transcriptase domain-containing protein n=1 Tax=Brassica cretica TaxID=69181 RepID=A0ABQ7BAP9_BRACR|nr:hypothetical protein DY000_02041477 [Brassica cretica]